MNGELLRIRSNTQTQVKRTRARMISINSKAQRLTNGWISRTLRCSFLTSSNSPRSSNSLNFGPDFRNDFSSSNNGFERGDDGNIDEEGILRRIERSFVKALTEENLRKLQSEGFCVCEDALERELSKALRAEIAVVSRNEHGGRDDEQHAMVPNSTRFVKDGKEETLEKRGIRELSAPFRDEKRMKYLRAMENDRSLMTLLNAMTPTASEKLFNVSLKAQVNDGDGARFPIHFDSDSATDLRRITCLVYLNEHWKEADGGQLVLYPFPIEEKVVIAPKLGTMVLFNSRYIAHSTMPSNAKKRYMFTIWLHAKSGLPNDDSLSNTNDNEADDEKNNAVDDDDIETNAEKQLAKILAPETRKHLIRVVLAEEWAESIAQAHNPESESTLKALRTHWEEIDIIARVLGRAFPLAFVLLEELIRTKKIGDFVKLNF